MRQRLFLTSALFCLFILALPAISKEKRYIYTFVPENSPHTFVLGNRVILSSKGLTISLEQLDALPFEDRFPVFQTRPNIHFIYFRITFRNRTGAPVEVNPIFFYALNDRKEFRKPLNYDEIHRLLSKMHKPEEFRDLFQSCLVDFFSPIPNGEEREGYLIFQNFREKAKTGIIKLENMSVGPEPVSFSVAYTLNREVITIE